MKNLTLISFFLILANHSIGQKLFRDPSAKRINNRIDFSRIISRCDENLKACVGASRNTQTELMQELSDEIISFSDGKEYSWMHHEMNFENFVVTGFGFDALQDQYREPENISTLYNNNNNMTYRSPKLSLTNLKYRINLIRGIIHRDLVNFNESEFNFIECERTFDGKEVKVLAIAAQEVIDVLRIGDLISFSGQSYHMEYGNGSYKFEISLTHLRTGDNKPVEGNLITDNKIKEIEDNTEKDKVVRDMLVGLRKFCTPYCVDDFQRIRGEKSIAPYTFYLGESKFTIAYIIGCGGYEGTWEYRKGVLFLNFTTFEDPSCSGASTKINGKASYKVAMNTKTDFEGELKLTLIDFSAIGLNDDWYHFGLTEAKELWPFFVSRGTLKYVSYRSIPDYTNVNNTNSNSHSSTSNNQSTYQNDVVEHAAATGGVIREGWKIFNSDPKETADKLVNDPEYGKNLENTVQRWSESSDRMDKQYKLTSERINRLFK